MLIIKGAIYQLDNELVIPHYTGEMWAVDATNYRKFDAFREAHDRDPGESDQELEYEGETYYSNGDYGPNGDYSPCHTKDITLISDLSHLKHDGSI